MKAYSILKGTPHRGFQRLPQFFLEYNPTASLPFLTTFVFLVKVAYFIRFDTNCLHFTTIDMINTNLTYFCQTILGTRVLNTLKLLPFLSIRVNRLKAPSVLARVGGFHLGKGMWPFYTERESELGGEWHPEYPAASITGRSPHISE